MKKPLFILLGMMLLFSCKHKPEKTTKPDSETTETEKNHIKPTAVSTEAVTLSLEEANALAIKQLQCLSAEYPRYTNRVLTGEEQWKPLRERHPAFFGCHSKTASVQAHWALVSILRQFPKIAQADQVRDILRENLSKEHIRTEMAQVRAEEFSPETASYGAWLMKLATEIHTWNDPLAVELEENLFPLTNLMEKRFSEWLPGLAYPIRDGRAENTAFVLLFAREYAQAMKKTQFLESVDKHTVRFYLEDDACPIHWEPGGYDYFSPCFVELVLMKKVLSEEAFKLWMKEFLPQIAHADFDITPIKQPDQTYLTSLNYSRAWLLYAFSDQDAEYKHLVELGDKHMGNTFLETGKNKENTSSIFALLALNERKVE